MQKVLFAVSFSILLFLFVISFQLVSGQTNKPDDQKISQDEKKLPDASTLQENSESPKGSIFDDAEYYSSKGLRSDLKAADVAAYVNVKSRQLIDQIGGGDCEQNKGEGYCLYLLKAEVKEVFKGKVNQENFEFYDTTDTNYQYKDSLLGEKIVFLNWSDNYPDKKMSLQPIENSTRSIRQNILEKMRNILNPESPIDENDENETYSFKSIKETFAGADVVVYADVTGFKPDESNEYAGLKPFILKATVKEGFKGKLKAGQTFEYKDDLLYRPMREEDLGEQVIYLKRTEEAGKTVYEKVEYTEGRIEHDILEKLRKIAKEKPTKSDKLMIFEK